MSESSAVECHDACVPCMSVSFKSSIDSKTIETVLGTYSFSIPVVLYHYDTYETACLKAFEEITFERKLKSAFYKLFPNEFKFCNVVCPSKKTVDIVTVEKMVCKYWDISSAISYCPDNKILSLYNKHIMVDNYFELYQYLNKNWCNFVRDPEDDIDIKIDLNSKSANSKYDFMTAFDKAFINEEDIDDEIMWFNNKNLWEFYDKYTMEIYNFMKN